MLLARVNLGSEPFPLLSFPFPFPFVFMSQTPHLRLRLNQKRIVDWILNL
jgi:hypothetical protein